MATTASTTTEFDLSPVKFSRLTRRGIILGLSLPQVIALSAAVAVFVASLYAGGPAALYTAPIWGTALGLAWVPVGGRKLVEWVPITLHWLLRQALRQTRYRKRVVKPRPAGTLALPGGRAPLRQYPDPETDAVKVHDPHGQTLTALLEVTHPSFILLDPGEQERRVHAWGRVLSTACRSTRIARLQVLERTVPDSGSGLAQWWAEQGNDDDSWVARTYRELIDRAGPAGERHVSTISLSLDMRAASRAIRTAGGSLKGAAVVLKQEMDTLTTALRTADLKPSDW